MNIVYVSLSYVPSRRASSVHVMKMCAALARAGHTVRLLAKQGHDADASADPHAFYGTSGFAVDRLPRPRFRGGGAIFAAATLRSLIAHRRSADLIYSRDMIGALAALELGMPTVAELHGMPRGRLLTQLIRRIAGHRSLCGLVVVSDALRRDLVAAKLVPAHAPIIVAHDAADPPAARPPRLSAHPTRPAAGRPRLGYVGSLYPGRGIELLIDLAGRLPSCDVELIGGSPADLARWRAEPLPPNLRLAGFVRPADLPARYASFDILLMPYPRSGIGVASGANDTSRWCSPMKMFEYMATGAPIISSDLPVLGEVLHDDQNALIAAADDPAAWQRAVERLIADPSLASRLASRAYDDLTGHHTWDSRIRGIFAELSLGR